MPSVVKPAPKKKPTGRVPFTFRVSTAALKGLERQATKNRVGSRQFLRDLVEAKFENDIVPKIEL
jgi:hypothetical protein